MDLKLSREGFAHFPYTQFFHSYQTLASYYTHLLVEGEDEDDGGGQLNHAGREDHEEGVGLDVGTGEDEAVVHAGGHEPQEERDEAAAAHDRCSNQRHLIAKHPRRSPGPAR